MSSITDVGPVPATRTRGGAVRQDRKPRGTLTIGVDQPGWATQLTYLEADLLRRIEEVAGAGAVQRVRVTVRPK